MSNLFIIGNGFDLAHGIQSGYSNFRNYLYEKYNCCCLQSKNQYLLGKLATNKPIAENEIVSFITEVIDKNAGGNWSNFEESLGLLDFSPYLKICNLNKGDKLLQDKKIKEINNIIKSWFSKLPKYFLEWIDQLDLNVESTKGFANLINEGDLFLTFNYTKVLEKIYNINSKNILHVHGSVDNNKVKLIFGHGNEKIPRYEYLDSKEYPLYDIHDMLRKDTSKIIAKNSSFFNNLSDIKKIYSYGFSYSDIDSIYIETIIKNIKNNKDIIWYLNDYNGSFESQAEVLMDLEFNETIKPFCIK